MSNSKTSSRTLLPESIMDTTYASTTSIPPTHDSDTPGDNPEPPPDKKPSPHHDDDDEPRGRYHIKTLFNPDGALRPFRLLKSDVRARAPLWFTDWHFNQLILASAVYLFFTNLLPGITFASDLFVRTGAHYGTIEVVFSTGLCGLIFSLYGSRVFSRCCAPQTDTP